MDMKQCQIGHENHEHQKIVDALTTLPEAECTPETDRELAGAIYSKEETAAVENHIRQYFGKFETLFHEPDS